MMAYQNLEEKAKWLRKTLFEMFVSTEQGHPGSVFSQVDILTALFYGNVIRYTPGKPDDPDRDKIIISKGHATMGLYPIFADLDYFPEAELERFGTPEGMLRIFGNITIPGIDATSGSLGHGPGIAAGFALIAKKERRDQRAFVVLSEGEQYEGSVWESALFAAHHELDNLIVILDRNRKIILGDTEDLLPLDPVEKKWEAFGWKTVTVDGHSFESLMEGFSEIGKEPGKPLLILANTVKGKGVSFMEHQPDWHYWQGVDEGQLTQARKELAL
jgi:transketolase